MISWRRFAATCAAAVALMLGGLCQAHAVTTLTFEGLQDREAVLDFYNGGTGGLGSGPGPNVGVEFLSSALALIDQDAGGTGNFGGEPSPSTVLFFLTESAATMNVPAGFDTGFSFFYSAINSPGTVTVYDALNATGNILATLNLPLTPTSGASDPTGQFSPLLPIGVTFNGIAKSVDFAGTANQIVFDNITFGSETPGGIIPEPASMALLGVGVLPLLGRLRRRSTGA